MLFNIYTTDLTIQKFNINTPQEHARLSECLEELLPTLRRTLGDRFTDENELDLVI